MPLDKSDRADLEAFKGDVKADVKAMNDAAIAHVEKIVAPFAPLAQDVAQLKADTAKQTPIIERLDKRSKRADAERKRRSIIDAEDRKRAEDKRKADLVRKKRGEKIAAVLGIIVALAELYRALKGHG